MNSSRTLFWKEHNLKEHGDLFYMALALFEHLNNPKMHWLIMKRPIKIHVASEQMKAGMKRWTMIFPVITLAT